MEINTAVFEKLIKKTYGTKKNFAARAGVTETTVQNWLRKKTIGKRFDDVCRLLKTEPHRLAAVRLFPKMKSNPLIETEKFFMILDKMRTEYQSDWTSNASDAVIRETIREYNKTRGPTG